jgi:hypothetical protein
VFPLQVATIVHASSELKRPELKRPEAPKPEAPKKLFDEGASPAAPANVEATVASSSKWVATNVRSFGVGFQGGLSHHASF